VEDSDSDVEDPNVEGSDCDVEDPSVEDADVEGTGAEDPGVEPEVLVGPVAGLEGAFATVTWKLPETVLPAASVAEQLTVVVPRTKTEPEAGEQFAEADASRLSVAEAG